MKRYFYLGVAILLLTQCSFQGKLPDFIEEENCFSATKGNSLINEDPYSYDAINYALQRIKKGTHITKIDQAQIQTIRSMKSIEPTHKVVALLPKTIDQYKTISELKDISISYRPFTDTKEFYVNNPYSYKATYINNEDIQVEKTHHLPTLYAVLPENRSLPDDIANVELYSCVIPQTVEDSDYNSILSLVAEESLAYQYGLERVAYPRMERVGKLVVNDPLINGNIPITQLEIRAQIGSNIIHVTGTSNDGTFYIPGSVIPVAHIIGIFSSHHWQIINEDEDVPYQADLGILGELITTTAITPINISSLVDSQIINTHRAVSFYYHGNHSILKYDNEQAIKIHCMHSYTAGGNYGEFYYGNIPFIKLYNYTNSTNTYLGTALHELGHNSLFGHAGGATSMQEIPRLFRESYASFVGWHLDEAYYASLGYSHSTSSSVANTQWRQSWTQNSTSLYTPLFSDLVDEYNQSMTNSSYINDEIEGIPISFIENSLVSCRTWTEFKGALASRIGIDYSYSQYQSYIQPYETWFQSN